ncbi:ABC transporter permease [Mesorhizobium sp. CN2-181]|uniref:ABC transporter permease n=1 Tax=Mesorhizobium yinganensis TaxID=3157707 RepID=UPI0032B7E5CF
MPRLIANRMFFSLFVLLAATLVIFFGISSISDPLGELRSEPNISPESLQRLIDRKHLEEPLVVQYGYWVKDMVTAQFGNDLKFDRPIWPELSRALVNTVQLVIFAELFAIVLAVIIGVMAGRFQYSVFDYGTTILSFIGYSIPIFWFALILQILAVNFYQTTGVRAVYISGLSSVDAPTGLMFYVDRIQHLILPILALSVTSIAAYSRYLRASMIEVINADYVRTARAKGLSEPKVVLRHALRNAAVPLATVVGVNLGTVFSGTIIIETIFSMPGMGLFFFNALSTRDVYSIMAWLMVTASLTMLFNLVTDIVYGLLDPRTRT